MSCNLSGRRIKLNSYSQGIGVGGSRRVEVDARLAMSFQFSSPRERRSASSCGPVIVQVRFQSQDGCTLRASSFNPHADSSTYGLVRLRRRPQHEKLLMQLL